ncbi:MAG: hypothetical protein CVU31_01150 [Betaproteobacteria bacterium HGW-Betaproteobacteria-4]|jgi:hypothetical protein|nr:MAG: hypothetical protein CVU31_01150 [Betaproteobacteria bacterium HGW-Betaproteobacteria-4]
MGTVIRTDFKRRQIALFLAANLAFLPAGYATETEIHVTYGPDGIEIFSNLPRDPVAAQGKPANEVNSGAALVVSQPAHLPWSAGAESNGQDSDTEAPGKSFLLDD